MRLSSLDDDLLAIDREAEHSNSLRAAASGAAPAVVAYLPEHRAWSSSGSRAAPSPPATCGRRACSRRVAAVCRVLHASARFVGDFDMFAIQQRYLAIVDERGFRLPERYLDLMPQVERIAEALAVRREATVPCNNDLLAGQLHRRRRQRLWVIDYEYGGNNDPCFELGNIWQESDAVTSGISPRSSSTATTAGTCGTRWPGRGCSG